MEIATRPTDLAVPLEAPRYKTGRRMRAGTPATRIAAESVVPVVPAEWVVPAEPVIAEAPRQELWIAAPTGVRQAAVTG